MIGAAAFIYGGIAVSSSNTIKDHKRENASY